MDITTQHQIKSWQKLSYVRSLKTDPQLSGMKLKTFFIIYRRLKTHKGLVSKELSCSDF